MIETFLLLGLGFVVGFKIAEFLHLQTFKRILEDLKITEQQMRDLARKTGIEVEDPRSEEDRELGIRETINIKIEQHGGQLYAFRADNDQFLGQGADRDTLVNSLAQKFKGVRMIVDEGKELLQKSHT